MKLYVVPHLKATGQLTYYESLGLFGPVIYALEGSIKMLKALSPIVTFMNEVILIVNSVVLMITLVITRFVFKHKQWAAIYMVVLSLVSVVAWLDIK